MFTNTMAQGVRGPSCTLFLAGCFGLVITMAGGAQGNGNKQIILLNDTNEGAKIKLKGAGGKYKDSIPLGKGASEKIPVEGKDDFIFEVRLGNRAYTSDPIPLNKIIAGTPNGNAKLRISAVATAPEGAANKGKKLVDRIREKKGWNNKREVFSLMVDGISRDIQANEKVDGIFELKPNKR